MQKREIPYAAETLQALRTIYATLTNEWPDRQFCPQPQYPESTERFYEFLANCYGHVQGVPGMEQQAPKIRAQFKVLSANDCFEASSKVKQKISEMLGVPILTSSHATGVDKDAPDYLKLRTPVDVTNNKAIASAIHEAIIVLIHELNDELIDLVTVDYMKQWLRGITKIHMAQLYGYICAELKQIDELKNCWGRREETIYISASIEPSCFDAFDKCFNQERTDFDMRGIKNDLNRSQFAQDINQHVAALHILGYGNLTSQTVQYAIFEPDFTRQLASYDAITKTYSLLRTIKGAAIRYVVDYGDISHPYVETIIDALLKGA